MRLLFQLAVLVTVFTTIFGYTEEEAWNDYKKKHRKNYRLPFDGGSQERIRRALFSIRNAEIIKHNSRNPGTYRLELNTFSDMSPMELDRYLGVKTGSVPSARLLETIGTVIESRQLPPVSLDYRYDPCLPAVKDQEQCGSCWAFSAITPVEFSKCSRSGMAVVLSEQQLVDCDKENLGCNGGWYTTAWDYIKRANGSAKKSFYPYVARDGTCRYNTLTAGAEIVSYDYVQTKNATAMQLALQQYGPLAGAMTVVPSFFYYASGVYSDPDCDGKPINHAIVIVGWGVLNGVDYWIGRNSWGSDWGLSGYFYIERGVDKCKIETYSAYVTAY